MRPRFFPVLLLLLLAVAAFTGVARALDFDDEDPQPPRAEIGLVYHYEIGSHAGCLPHRYEILSGALPPGLKLSQIAYNRALVDGMATEAGTFSVWLAVKDCDNKSAETLFTFDVWARRFSISTDSLKPARVGATYSQVLETSGIASNTTWTVSKGALPAGLTLSADGTFSGTPTAAGTSTFTIKATGVAKDFSGTRIHERDYTLAVQAPLSVKLSRPAAEVGIRFRSLLSAGQAGTWSATGALPPGLAVSPDGSVTGVPTRAGAYSLPVRFVDATGSAQSFQVRLVVRTRLAIATSRLPSAIAGRPYNARLRVQGGVAPLRWSGSLPAGLKLSSNGTIAGKPSSAGTFRFSLRVRDSLGARATKTAVLVVR